MKIPKKDEIIETERCIIKMPSIFDGEKLYNLIGEETVKYMAWEKGEDSSATKKNIAESLEKVEKGESWEAIALLKGGEIMGRFGIHTIDYTIKSACFGYWIGKKYWGNGYILECLEAFKKKAFEELGFNRLVIKLNSGNTNSEKVAQKAGFLLDGVLRGDAFEKGEFIDKVVYSMLKKDYFSQK